MWTISKKFEFDYGHRVWAQQIDKKASGMNVNKCRHLHGHRGVIEVSISGAKLDSSSMVIDFNNLNWLKKYIEDTIDHKTILDINDPLVNTLFSINNINQLKQSLKKNPVARLSISANTIEKEFAESFVFMYGVPTSEELSRMFADIINIKLEELKNKTDFQLTKVTFWETPKSKSVYEPTK